MNKSDLLAPEKYNIISEIEKYASNTSKKAIIYKDNEHSYSYYQNLISYQTDTPCIIIIF